MCPHRENNLLIAMLLLGEGYGVCVCGRRIVSLWRFQGFWQKKGVNEIFSGSLFREKDGR